jgi:hypothetical protein
MYTRTYCSGLHNKWPGRLQRASQIRQWRGVNIEKVITKFLTLHKILFSITMFTGIRYWTLFWASLIQPLLTHYTPICLQLEVFSCHPCRKPHEWFRNTSFWMNESSKAGREGGGALWLWYPSDNLGDSRIVHWRKAACSIFVLF